MIQVVIITILYFEMGDGIESRASCFYTLVSSLLLWNFYIIIIIWIPALKNNNTYTFKIGFYVVLDILLIQLKKKG